MTDFIAAEHALPVQAEKNKWSYLLHSIEQAFYMLLAVFILQFCSLSILDVSNLIVLAYSLLLAIPVWFYQKEYHLYKRRVFLSSIGTDQGQAVRWFWNATGLKLWLYLKSIIYAFSIISMSSLFSEMQWYVIYADVFIIVLIQWFNKAWINREIKPVFHGLVSRRILYFLNIIFILSALVYIDFALLGSIDTRDILWSDVFTNTFEQYYQGNNSFISYFIGLLAAVDAVGWHYMQVYAPSINNINIRLLAWLLFLIPAAINITLILFYLLGVHNLIEIKQHKGWKVLGQSIASKAFMITILVLAAVSIYLSTLEITPSDVTPSDITGIGNTLNKDSTALEVLIDPCANHTTEVKQLLVDIDQEITDERNKIIADIDKNIDQQLNQMFGSVESGTDDFLDWYYTVTGEYQRLIAVLSADAGSTVQKQLQYHLFEKTNFASRLDGINTALNDQNSKQLALIIKNVSAKAGDTLFENTCTLPEINLSQINSFSQDAKRIGASMLAGGVIGKYISKGAGKAAATAMTSKIAAKKMFQSSIALMLKAGAKKGAGSLLTGIGIGALAGMACGPGCSIIFGVAGGVSVWLGVDKLMIEVDEHLNRTEFKQEILNSILKQKQQLSAVMKKNHQQRIDAAIHQMNTAIDKYFIPYNDSF